MPKIKAFHAKVGVRGNDGNVKVLKVDLPDYATVHEVLTIVGEALGSKTAGEIIKQLSEQIYSYTLDDATLGVSVEPATGFKGTVVDWDYQIV